MDIAAAKKIEDLEREVKARGADQATGGGSWRAGSGELVTEEWLRATGFVGYGTSQEWKMVYVRLWAG